MNGPDGKSSSMCRGTALMRPLNIGRLNILCAAYFFHLTIIDDPIVDYNSLTPFSDEIKKVAK